MQRPTKVSINGWMDGWMDGWMTHVPTYLLPTYLHTHHEVFHVHDHKFTEAGNQMRWHVLPPLLQ